jgi:hypothetical protein
MVAWLLRSLLKMRLNATRLGSIASSRSFGDQLDDLAGQVPSLDLNFAQNKSLIDDYSGTTLVTHTRASSGTYVDSEGVIRTATTNLLLRSEEFDDASWINLATTVTSNAIAAPNGTNTADFLTENSTTNAHNVAINTVVVNGALCTFSVYAKRNGRDLQLLFGSSDVSGNPYVNFDLANGTVASTSGTITGAVQPVGDGWYRCSVTVTSAVDVGFTCVCGLITSTSAGRAESYAGDGTSGIYLWGAQLEQSATVGEYIPTTSTINSAPRFDHDPTTGESLGLLVEESRTNLIQQSEDFGDAVWSSSAASISTNTTAAPDGTTSGDTFTSSGTTIVSQPIAKTASAITYSSSLFVKGTVTAFTFSIDDGTAANRGRVVFNLSTGTISSTNNDGAFTGTSGTITSFSNNWYRLTVATTTNSTVVARMRLFWTGAGTSLDFWGAQLEAGSFPTSYIPTTTATVTRAADVASITGSNFGTTRTNLLVRSEEFDNAAWTKGNSSITANTIVAPDGTLTADKLVEDTSSATHYARRSTSPTINTNPITFSVYVKAAERIYVGLAIQEATTFTRQSNVNFNLGSGTANTVNSIGGAGSASATIIPVGNGWYRCTLTTTLGGTDTNALSWIYVSTSSGFNYTGDGTSGIYIWGAQLEVGSAVTPYIQSPSVFTSRASSGTYVGGNGLIQTATTNEARYDHDPISLISKGLLLEEARTNLVLRSEEFDNASWTKASATITANESTAPDGTTTADLWTSTGSTSTVNQSYTKDATARTYSASIWVKSSVTAFTLALDSGSNTNRGRAIFNFATGVLTTVDSVGTFTNTSGTITAYPDSWYRVTVTTTTSTATTVRFIVFFSAPGATAHIWGAQLEENAAFATSYIPTTTATVTRAADISTSVATSVFESSWYRQDEGTVFADARTQQSATSHILAGVSTGSFASSAYFVKGSNNLLAAAPDTAPSSLNITLQSVSSNVGLRAALAFTAGTGSASATMNGGTVGTDASTGIPITMSQMGIGTAPWSIGTTLWNGHIARLTYWPTRLSNEVLQRISQ